MKAHTGQSAARRRQACGQAAHDLATDIPVYATDILAYFSRPYLP
jgi:hypothetical protein